MKAKPLYTGVYRIVLTETVVQIIKGYTVMDVAGRIIRRFFTKGTGFGDVRLEEIKKSNTMAEQLSAQDFGMEICCRAF